MLKFDLLSKCKNAFLDPLQSSTDVADRVHSLEDLAPVNVGSVYVKRLKRALHDFTYASYEIHCCPVRPSFFLLYDYNGCE